MSTDSPPAEKKDRRGSIRIGGFNQATVFLEEVASDTVVATIPAVVDDISFSGLKLTMTPDAETLQRLRRKDFRVRVEIVSNGQVLSAWCVLRRTEEEPNRVRCGLAYGKVEAQTIMKMVEAVYGSEPRPRVRVVYGLLAASAGLLIVVVTLLILRHTAAPIAPALPRLNASPAAKEFAALDAQANAAAAIDFKLALKSDEKVSRFTSGDLFAVAYLRANGLAVYGAFTRLKPDPKPPYLHLQVSLRDANGRELSECNQDVTLQSMAQLTPFHCQLPTPPTPPLSLSVLQTIQEP